MFPQPLAPLAAMTPTPQFPCIRCMGPLVRGTITAVSMSQAHPCVFWYMFPQPHISELSYSDVPAAEQLCAKGGVTECSRRLLLTHPLIWAWPWTRRMFRLRLVGIPSLPNRPELHQGPYTSWKNCSCRSLTSGH